MENDRLYITILLDFFGELLSEKQREYLGLYHNEDLSLSEIAEKAGVTKQGVYDVVTRAEKKLVSIEEKTGVVQRWLNTQSELRQAEDAAAELLSLSGPDAKSAELARKLVLAFERLKNQ